jgi:hypothetical protein
LPIPVGLRIRVAKTWHAPRTIECGMSVSGSMRRSTTIPAAPFAKVRKSRLLVPKEHGAYFQLGVPLVTALAMGRPTGPAYLFALSAAAAFLCHESLLVVIGGRGTRARREEGRRAARCLAFLGTLAVASGAAAWAATAPLGMSLIPLLPLGMAAAVGVLIALRAEKTMMGEVLVGTALSSAALPVAWAAGVDPLCVVTVWIAWIIIGGTQTYAVRSIIQSRKGHASVLTRVAPVALIVSAAVAFASWWPWAALATGPAIVLALVWTVVPPDARRLRRIGWALAGATMAASAILVVSVRREAGRGPHVSGMGRSSTSVFHQ